MASWITTKHILLRQDAKSLHTRNHESEALGSPTGNMDIHWDQQCITTDVKMSTFLLRLATPWANIFYALCKRTFLPQFQDNLLFNKRFIHDVLGVWQITDPATNDATWAFFCNAMNDPLYSLEWIVSPQSHQVEFMDLTITLQDGKILTTLYEKPSSFHLYIPPHSCHPPGLLRGMVFGMMNRIHTLCTDKDAQKARAIAFFRHLQRRGFQPHDLYPLFNRAIVRAREYVANPPISQTTNDGLRSIQFFHIE
jgi:hypothetical protein